MMESKILVIFLVLAGCSLVSAGGLRKRAKDVRSQIMVMKILREVHMKEDEIKIDRKTEEVVRLMSEVKQNNNSNCSCYNYTCGCCLHLEVQKISLNETGCVNISYLPDEYGIEVMLTLNNRVLIDEKISVKNPPPICAAIPYVHKLASLCLRFHDLDFKNKQFSGCADIEAELEGIVVEKFDLGCFHIPPTKGKKSLKLLE